MRTIPILATFLIAGIAGAQTPAAAATPADRPSWRVRGYVQADSRFRGAVDGVPGTSTLLVRRARIALDATMHERFDLRVMPDFADGTPQLVDAYADARLWPQLAVRAGRFKPALGLERLQSATDLRFVERGLPTNLVPSRDIGVQASGSLAKGLLAYQVGAFNGVADLGNAERDASRSLDQVARVLLVPFARSILRERIELGVGIAASTGIERGSPSAPALPSYRAPSQERLFRYRGDGSDSGTVVADGTRRRLVPQAFLNVGPIGLLGEFVRSQQQVRRGSATIRLDHSAWQLAGSWFPTGERATSRAVTPVAPFDPTTRRWGALELSARYGVLDLDPDAFPLYASPAVSSRRARAGGAGVTWHLVRGVKLLVNYERTTFAGGSTTGDRPTEHLVLTRVQSAF